MLNDYLSFWLKECKHIIYLLLDWCAHQELNLKYRFRKPRLYPFNYRRNKIIRSFESCGLGEAL